MWKDLVLLCLQCSITSLPKNRLKKHTWFLIYWVSIFCDCIHIFLPKCEKALLRDSLSEVLAHTDWWDLSDGLEVYHSKQSWKSISGQAPGRQELLAGGISLRFILKPRSSSSWQWSEFLKLTPPYLAHLSFISMTDRTSCNLLSHIPLRCSLNTSGISTQENAC